MVKFGTNGNKITADTNLAYLRIYFTPFSLQIGFYFQTYFILQH